MPSFNEMRLLNGSLLVFSVLVTLFFADWSYYGYQPYKNIYEVLYYLADFKFIYAVR